MSLFNLKHIHAYTCELSSGVKLIHFNFFRVKQIKVLYLYSQTSINYKIVKYLWKNISLYVEINSEQFISIQDNNNIFSMKLETDLGCKNASLKMQSNNIDA